MNMKAWALASVAGCAVAASMAASAGEAGRSQVYTYKVVLDADGRLVAAQPVRGGEDAASRLVAAELQHWAFQPVTHAGVPEAASTYVRVVAVPDADGGSPRILRATTGPAPDRLSQPAFPAAAQREGRQGVVVLQLAIDAAGKVSTAQVHDTEGDVNRAMAAAALAAARDWTFHPEQVDGAPVGGDMLVPVCFLASPDGDCGWTGPNAQAYDRDTVLALEPRVRLAASGR
jgi:TonB family protein